MCFLLILSAFWSNPVRLTNNPEQDKNPAVSHRVLFEYFHPICLLWETDRDGNLNIYSRFYTSIGDSVWDDTIFPMTKDAGVDSNPSVALDRNGTFWAVWQSNRTGNWDIFVSSFAGDSWTTPYQLTTSDSVDINPSIAAFNDSLWVVWQTDRDGKWNIYASKYNGTGWSAPFKISWTDTGNHTNPIIYGDDGFLGYSLLCAYENDINGNKDIYLDDLLQDSTMQITTDTFSDEMPAITEGYLVWQSLRTGNYDIYGYDLSGGSVDTITTDTGEDINPATIHLPIVSKWIPYWTVWQTDRTGNWDIYSNIWGDTTVPVDTNAYSDINPVITAISDTNHYYWVWAIWESERDGNKEIYGAWQRVWEGGIEETSGGRHSVLRFYAKPISNPSRGTAVIEYSLRNRTNVNLRIYDLTGRLVAEPINKEMNAGIHRIRWNANTSGIYFYRLKTDKKTATGKIILVK